MAYLDNNVRAEFNADQPLKTIIDKTTDVNYTFMARSLDPTKATTDAGWQCYRITNATGTLLFAQGVAGLKNSRGKPLAVGVPSDEFAFVAADAATYTYS